jgi:hypothetical protein
MLRAAQCIPLGSGPVILTASTRSEPPVTLGAVTAEGIMKRLLMGLAVIAALSAGGSALSADVFLRAYAAHRGALGQRETGVTPRPPSAIPDLNAHPPNVATSALNVRDGRVLEFVTPRPPSAIPDLNARPPNVATSALNVRDGRVLEFLRWKKQFRADINGSR